jgi:hypothetical protein
MNGIIRHLVRAAILAVAVCGVTTVRADDDGFKGQRNAYVVTNLVSNLPGQATFQDTNLQNAWGLAFTPAASPFWIADNADGLSTLYGPFPQ